MTMMMMSCTSCFYDEFVVFLHDCNCLLVFMIYVYIYVYLVLRIYDSRVVRPSSILFMNYMI